MDKNIIFFLQKIFFSEISLAIYSLETILLKQNKQRNKRTFIKGEQYMKHFYRPSRKLSLIRGVTMIQRGGGIQRKEDE